jgi:hypothetical protein
MVAEKWVPGPPRGGRLSLLWPYALNQYHVKMAKVELS